MRFGRAGELFENEVDGGDEAEEGGEVIPVEAFATEEEGDD